MLEVIGVSKYFGGFAALEDVNLSVREKEIVGLIGPNGAGKTTLFNVITGIYRPTSGKIMFKGEDITGLKPYEICKRGIARTFQIVRPFLEMTVLENVMIGGIFGRSKATSMNTVREESLYYLKFVGLAGKENILVKNLTLVDRKRVELATALNTKPRIVLLDEPLAGLNPTEIKESMDVIRRIRDELGITVFWVEHVMKAVMNLADYIIVLHHGRKIAEGVPREVANNKEVIDAYLGEKYLL
jgi:branched-chain amino acid transport system ATP-binding protein